MHGIGTVINLVLNFQHHALVNIESDGRYLLHNRAVFPCIDQYKVANILPNAHKPTVVVTKRALLVVDKQNFGLLHAAPVEPVGEIINGHSATMI